MANETMMTPPAVAKATTAPNQSAVNSDLGCWMGVPEQIQNMHDQPPQLPDWVDETRKTRAEKRMDASLRRMEIEQKARLLAETQQRMAEARRRFESRGVAREEGNAGFPSTMEDMFQAMKAREDLLAMEREQKERLLQESLEMQGRLLGEEWPAARDPLEAVRFDHVPKHGLLYKRLLAEAFSGHHPARLEESNE
jgi:hypothetical protein